MRKLLRCPPTFFAEMPRSKIAEMPPPHLFISEMPTPTFFCWDVQLASIFFSSSGKIAEMSPLYFFCKDAQSMNIIAEMPPPHFFLLRCSAHLIFLAKLLLRWTHLIFFPEMPNLLIFLALLISACQLLRYGPLFFFPEMPNFSQLFFCGIPASSSF